MKQRLIARAASYHDRTPLLRKLPFPAVAIIVTLIFVNIAAWTAIGILLVCPCEKTAVG